MRDFIIGSKMGYYDRELFNLKKKNKLANTLSQFNKKS